jgi:hypothetical protein
MRAAAARGSPKGSLTLRRHRGRDFIVSRRTLLYLGRLPQPTCELQYLNKATWGVLPARVFPEWVITWSAPMGLPRGPLPEPYPKADPREAGVILGRRSFER